MTRGSRVALLGWGSDDTDRRPSSNLIHSGQQTVRARRGLVAAVLLSLVLLSGIAVVGAADHAYDIQLSDNDPGATDIEHTWTVEFDGFEGDTVDRIELDYGESDVGIDTDSGTDAFDVAVDGESIAVEDVDVAEDVVTLHLDEAAVSADAELELTTAPIFTNPDEIGVYEATIQVVADEVETTPGTVEFSIGSGYVGTVTDVNGDPLDDVTVTIESTGASTTTDADGKYAIEYDDWRGATLEFERDGYATAMTSETGALGEIEAVDDVPLHGQIGLTSVDLSDNTSEVTDVEYVIEFGVKAPVDGVESISIDLSDAQSEGLSTENVSDEHVDVSIGGEEIDATLQTEPGATTLGIELDEPSDVPAGGTHQMAIRAVDNPKHSPPDSPYEIVVGLHDERSTDLETALTHTIDEFTISRVNVDREAWWYVAEDGSPTEVVHDGNTAYFNAINYVHAVNVTTGEDEWVTEIPAIGEFTPGPTVADGTVYVPDEVGNVTALDADNGEQQWTFEADDSIRSVLAIDDENVYFGGGPWDTTVYAVDRDTGEETWSFDRVSDEVRPVAVDDGMVYAGSADEHLYAINASTGFKEWSFEADGMVSSEIEVVDGTIYTTADETVYAIDPETESTRWTAQLSNSAGGTTVGEELVYVISDGNLVALELDDGEVAWGVEFEGASAPVVSGSSVFVGDNRELVFSLDADTGERQDIFGVWGQVDERPTVAGEMLYVSTRVGSVHSFDARLPAEPTGTANIDAPITVNHDRVDVDVTFEATEGESAYLVFENEDTGETYSTVLTQSGTESIETGALGGISAGDTIRVELYVSADRETLLADDVVLVDPPAIDLADFEIAAVEDPIKRGEPLDVIVTGAVDHDGEPFTGTVDLQFEQPDGDNQSYPISFEDGEATQAVPIETDVEVGKYPDLKVWKQANDSVNTTYDVEIVEEPTSVLEIDDFASEFSDGEAGDDYGTVNITVSETADAQTENLTATLEVWYQESIEVYRETIDDVELENDTAQFEFDVGSFDQAGPYMVVVTANADNADTAMETDGFWLSPSADEPTGTVELTKPVSEDDEAVEVTYTFENTTNDEALIGVGHADGDVDDGVLFETVDTDGTLVVDVEDIGGINAGDELHAAIYDSDDGSDISPDQLEDAPTVGELLDQDSAIVQGDFEAEPIDECTVIYSSGVYELTGNVSTDQVGDGETCIDIRADDVTFDGNGHGVVAGSPVEWRDSNYGIAVSGDDVTVRNVTTTGWDELGTGLMIEDAADVRVKDATATNNTFGIRTNGVEGFVIEGTRVENNERPGVQLLDSNDGMLRNVTAEANAESDGWAGVYVRGESTAIELENVSVSSTLNGGHGIRITDGSTNVTISNSTVEENNGSGLLIQSSAVDVVDTVARNNHVDVSVEADDVSVDSLNIGSSTAPETIVSFEGSHLEVRGISSPPPTPDDASIGRFVEIVSIDDGSFNGAIQYESSDLEDLEDEDLHVLRFDDGEWTTVASSSVDGDANIVEFETTNPGVFGVFATEDSDPDPEPEPDPEPDPDPQPDPDPEPEPEPEPDVETIDAALTEPTVAVNETVEVVATVENAGNASGEHTVTLEIDGVAEDEHSLTLEANESETVTFTPAFDEPGEYTVAVDGITAGVVTVEDEPETKPEPEAVRSIDEQAVDPGETVTITVDVTADDQATFTVVESFDAFPDVEIVDDDGADLAGVTDANDELVATFSDREQATLVFEATLPEVGDETFAFDGYTDQDGTHRSTTGQNAIDTIAETEIDAVRSVDEHVLTPGETVTVSIDVTADDQATFTLVESFDAFADVEIVDEDGAALTGVTDANDELVATFSDREQATLVFEATVPEDVEDGATIAYDGFVDVEDVQTDTTGDATATVVDLPDDADVLHAEQAAIDTDEDGNSRARFSNESALDSISFAESTAGHATVTELAQEPEVTGQSPDSTVTATRITVPDEAANDNATLTMRVPTDRIDEMGVDAETLRVDHFADGQWQSLETEIVDQNEEVVVIEAETPGFSYFTISATEDSSGWVGPWTVVLVLIGIIALVTAGIASMRRRQ